MKKTLITLMAFAGMAAADTATLTVGTTQDTSTWTAGVKLELPTDSPLDLSYVGIAGGGGLVGKNGSGAEAGPFTSYGEGILSPMIGFKQKEYDGYIDLTFTVKADTAAPGYNTPGYAWQIDSLTFDMKSVTAGGGNHDNGIGSMDVTLLSSTKRVLGGGTVSLGANSASGTVTVTPAESVILSSSETLTVRIARTAGSGAYQGYLAITGGSVGYSYSAIPLITTVCGYDYEDGMLILTVAGSLADVERAIITGFEDGVISGILGEVGVNGMVGLTLTDGTDTLVADADKLVGFRGEYGTYYGEQVGDGENVSWQYNVSYIPEPATATLSLLALCGLAARRRRK